MLSLFSDSKYSSAFERGSDESFWTNADNLKSHKNGSRYSVIVTFHLYILHFTF